MDEGKILIVDLSYLSELSAKLFGGFITTLVQQCNPSPPMNHF